MSNWNSNYYYNQEQYNNEQHYSHHPEHPYVNDIHSFSGQSTYCGTDSTSQTFVDVDQSVQSNMSLNTTNRPGTSDSTNGVQTCIDIRHSNLTPTAAEFKPRGQFFATTTENKSGNGTIKKSSPQCRNKKINSVSKFWQANNKLSKNQPSIESEFQCMDPMVATGPKRNSISINKMLVVNKHDQKNGEKAKTELYEHYQESHGSNSKNYYKNKNKAIDHYSRDNTTADSKKRWNKNGYNKYNRKYDGQRYKDSSKENWRQPSNGAKEIDKEKKTKGERYQLDFKNAACQRERLQEMLEHLQLECLVCCDKLCHTDFVWSCKQCYNILHLNCVKKWANASKLESGWRCPACQNTYSSVPKDYHCYCDKITNPTYEPGTLPHSCGEICGRKGRTCNHTCVLLCHPGPCPDCTVPILKPCGCGSTKATVVCGADVPVTCQNICKKLLNCGIHACSSTCHPSECQKCEAFVKQECYCGKLGRKIRCTEDVKGNAHFECGDICGKLLDCGNHTCELVCHSGSCPPCSTSIDTITTCPCGQTKLTVERKSCFDTIPTCEKICNKVFSCGQPSDPHHCQKKCHQDACPPCPLTTVVKCRCGYMDKEIACKDVTTKADDARCEKKCVKLRHCCKHKCNQLCCIEVEHVCPLPCNRMLSCGLHRCEENCHRGRCLPCWRSSFQELYCECGASVIYPPVPCGTKPPSCSKPCSRARSCGHDAFHNCHPGPCPPCTVLCKRWCHGKHEQRTTILCYQDDFSCGLPCGKDMPCGQHKCIQVCHADDCQIPCTQPCPKLRPNCEHPCNQPCHIGECPDVPCKQIVRVTCQCGLRSSTRTCMDLTGEYQSIAMSQLASKIADIQKGQAVDITDILGNQKKFGAPKTLECTEECRVAERNRRLAIGLQIRNPDLSAKLTPRYSDFMRGWAKKDPRFCQYIHEKLTELVQKAKQSKQKSRSHSFESMNRDKRSFVHEYCQLFGCESEAYDAEPNRNVVATAYRDKSWLPSIGLVELMQRESGQRKVPGPVFGNKNNVLLKRDLVPLKSSNKSNLPSTSQGEYVDYFDDPPV